MELCIVCEGSLTRHRRYHFKTKVFRRVYRSQNVFRCTTCSLSQADMEKVESTDLSRYYADQYRVVSETGAASAVAHALWKLRADALTELAREYAPANVRCIFEVGAGYGVNLRALGKVFPDAELLTDEPSQVIERRGETRQASLAGGRFDIILLSHVLEHFENPKSLLEKAAKALNPGGVILIEVPNDVDGIVRYNVVDEPHLTFFEEQSLRFLLGRIDGLELIDLYAAGPSVTPMTPKILAKRVARAFIEMLPGLSRAMATRGSRKAASLDFESRNPNGWFLRAVLRQR